MQFVDFEALAPTVSSPTQMEMEPQGQSSPWILSLLEVTFFVPCSLHENVKKNEKNVFCLDCRTSICLHCRENHSAHRLLQIRRYVYCDVVLLADCEKLFDCESIQWYVTNNAKVLFLHNRPLSRPLKTSGRLCMSCERNLERHNFCSLACKVTHLVKQNRGANPNSEAGNGSSSSSSGGASSALTAATTGVSQTCNDQPQTLFRRRKGVPYRSPLI